MKNEPFEDGVLPTIVEKKHLTQNVCKRLTIAQSIRRSKDAYRACITSFIRREVIRSDDGQSDKKVFHFEDGSALAFMVTYAAIEDWQE